MRMTKALAVTATLLFLALPVFAGDLSAPRRFEERTPVPSLVLHGLEQTHMAWYNVQQSVSWMPDICDVNRVGTPNGQTLVVFPIDPGPDGVEFTADDPFDCYGLDGGTLPDGPDLGTLRQMRACTPRPSTLYDCPGGNYQKVVDPVSGWFVHYFPPFANEPGARYYIVWGSVSGFKGSLGTAFLNGQEQERHTTSTAAKDAGYDFCLDIGYSGNTIGKCGVPFGTAANGNGLTNQYDPPTPTETHLSDFRNSSICPGPECKKVVLLTLSAEWCPPCQTEASHAEGLYQDYVASGFQPVEILIEDNGGSPQPWGDKALPKRWAARFGLTFPICNDDNYTTWTPYNVGGSLPSHIMMDDSGKIFWRDAGYSYDGANPCNCPFATSPNQSIDCQMRCLIEERI